MKVETHKAVKAVNGNIGHNCKATNHLGDANGNYSNKHNYNQDVTSGFISEPLVTIQFIILP
jgi:hypothetical protein